MRNWQQRSPLMSKWNTDYSDGYGIRESEITEYKKPGKRGIMPADKVSFYNRIDIGIFICFMDICLGHNGVGFEKTLYSDAGDDDKELVLNAKYRLCG